MVSSGQIDVKPLISHLFKLEDGIKAFETAKTCSDGVIKVQIECYQN
jgi:L-iditol 2-dehydrogenase